MKCLIGMFFVNCLTKVLARHLKQEDMQHWTDHNVTSHTECTVSPCTSTIITSGQLFFCNWAPPMFDCLATVLTWLSISLVLEQLDLTFILLDFAILLLTVGICGIYSSANRND